MITELSIADAYLFEGRVAADHRGMFRKVLDSTEPGIPKDFLHLDEVAISHNRLAGTLRGMHYQEDPFAQTKVVWAASGRLHDVLVDLRPESPSYGRSLAVELSTAAATAVLVPVGVAHGFQTLEDDTSVVYLMRGGYSASHAKTIRWDDPTLAIDWPLSVTVISESDRNGMAWPVS